MSTKNKSAGSQHNTRGIVQGVGLVDPSTGLPITSSNPLPVSLSGSGPLPVVLTDGSVNIGTVNAELEVQLSHENDSPDSGDVADSVQVGDGTEILQIEADGSARVEDDELQKLAAGIQPLAHDEVSIAYVSGGPADGEIETVTYLQASTPVATLTMSYDGMGRLDGVTRS